MSRKHLTDKFIKHAKVKVPNRKLDKYFDNMGIGLMILIHSNGYKQWKQRVSVRGVLRELGLGTYPQVSLAQARQKAMANYAAAKEGHVTIASRFRSIESMTFEELAGKRHEMLKQSWKNLSYSKLWIRSLENYAFPFIGHLQIEEITRQDIMDILMQPVNDSRSFWYDKPESARHIRQRMEDIFQYAMALSMRNDNPVTAITAVLPRQKHVATPMRSLPYEDVAAAIATIRRERQIKQPRGLCLEWLVLTATRSSESRCATWKEIDLDRKLWTIPAKRMKTGQEHRIPLSDRCLEILKELQARSKYHKPGLNDFLFKSRINNRELSSYSLKKCLMDNGIDAVPHGFRSTFRTWVQEQTNAPSAVAEACLAHTNPNRIEAAYARSDYLDKRRVLMQLWADYLAEDWQK